MRLHADCRKTANLSPRPPSARAKIPAHPPLSARPGSFQKCNISQPIFPLRDPPPCAIFTAFWGEQQPFTVTRLWGAALFYPYRLDPVALPRSFFRSPAPNSGRNSGLCHPHTAHRQGRSHFPISSAPHTTSQSPPVTTESTACRQTATRTGTNGLSSLQCGQCAANPMRSDPSLVLHPALPPIPSIP